MSKILLGVSLALIVLLFGSVVQAQEKATIKFGESDLTISGYGHFWFASIDEEKDLGDADDKSSGFDTRRFRLILTGHVVPEISFKVQFDMEDELLRDYWLKFNKFFETENLTLNATVGQGKIHFSEAERIWVSPAARIIRGPMIYERVLPAGVALGNSTIADRDMGIVLDGTTLEGKLKFFLGSFNGSGIGDTGETNPGDNNDQNDFLARVICSPFEDEQLKGLTFSVGSMNGAQPDLVGPAPGVPMGINKRTRMSATVQYKKDDLSVLVEQINQTVEASVASPKTWDDEETKNFYLEGSYTLRPSFLKEGQILQPVLRYQTYEYDDGDLLSKLDNVGNSDWKATMTTIGANLILNSHVRFMLNYNMVDDDTFVPVKNKDMDVDNDEILLQLEMKF